MSLKNPTLVMWMPNSFGTWSSTITSPTPVLKPVSTGDEMKLETKPRRITRASSSATPTNAASVAVAVTSFAGSPSGTTMPELGARQDRERARRADAEDARRAEQRVDEHRHERGVQPHRDRQAGHGGVGHGLWQDDRGRREAGDDIEAEGRAAGSDGRRCDRMPGHMGNLPCCGADCGAGCLQGSADPAGGVPRRGLAGRVHRMLHSTQPMSRRQVPLRGDGKTGVREVSAASNALESSAIHKSWVTADCGAVKATIDGKAVPGQISSTLCAYTSRGRCCWQ